MKTSPNILFKIVTFVLQGGYPRRMSISKFQKLEG